MRHPSGSARQVTHSVDLNGSETCNLDDLSILFFNALMFSIVSISKPVQSDLRSDSLCRFQKPM